MPSLVFVTIAEVLTKVEDTRPVPWLFHARCWSPSNGQVVLTEGVDHPAWNESEHTHGLDSVRSSAR